MDHDELDKPSVIPLLRDCVSILTALRLIISGRDDTVLFVRSSELRTGL